MHRLKRHCFTSTRGSFLLFPCTGEYFDYAFWSWAWWHWWKPSHFDRRDYLWQVCILHVMDPSCVSLLFSQVHTHYYVYLAIQIHKIWMCLLLWQSSMFHDYGWLRIAFAGQSATSISFIYLLPTSLNWHECIPFLSGLLLLYTRWFYHPFPQFLKMTLINWAFVCTQLLPKPMKW